MAEIIIKDVGPNKVKVISLYQQLTGSDLKEAKETLDAVQGGQLLK